ncbi:MAG TPA: glycosyltransferase [Firmicutes bacterium]|nr:glycosyltransferase [Bacillota bacterium]
MNDNGKISVIIPAYTAGKTIGKCLDSLFART